MRFSEYLATRKYDKTPSSTYEQAMEADFIRDAKSDLSELDHVQTWDDLKTHLDKYNACEEAVTGAREAWRNFEQLST